LQQRSRRQQRAGDRIRPAAERARLRPKTSQSGWDIGWTIGFYPGITSSATGKSGIVGQIDARQNFLTFGTKAGGTVKVGRTSGCSDRMRSFPT